MLVLPGDHPDPSVVKIGDTYWASSTTSNWAPAFPLMFSKDLVHWKQKGYVFNELPAWADYYFWAPEITYDNGKVYVYYAAHKKGGNLCIGVASADKPEGPYKDHGPLMCQEVGSIDAFPMRDENGKLYLIWKEDANSVGRPTSIWAMEMNEERTALVGEKKALFRNDVAWEGNLVEGASIIKHGDYFYAFYAGSGCCGLNCSYGVGIARSKRLLGPWEKFAMNPVIKHSDKNRWTCPGHGTPVEMDGRFYFLYHAYDNKSNVFTGRQGLLTEFSFTPDGWIRFNGTPAIDPVATNSLDKFSSHKLSDAWQWSVFKKPAYTIRWGKLKLNGEAGPSGSYVAQKIMKADYTATTFVKAKKSSAIPGIAAIGDEKNMVSAQYTSGSVNVIVLRDGREELLTSGKIGAQKNLWLRLRSQNGKDLFLSYSINGKDFIALNELPIDGSFLPPWDRAVRVGIISKGSADQKAAYDGFEIRYL
ncbi:MAG TPA: family 43 glycosylhydrolase [Flavisolibacter sp.]|nr:family 43 glycosylhydrolase [Flavisolibacter sp.]